MAENGRPSERGHCLLALPHAVWLFVTRVVLRPSRWRLDPYPPEAAEAPDDVMAVADGLGFQRSELWTGDNVTVPAAPAIVAADDITTYQASAEIEGIVRVAQGLYLAQRINPLASLGGSPELGDGARWTRRGWKVRRWQHDGR